MSTDYPRLIEDYLPIQAISAEASREKSVRKGHISTLHLWVGTAAARGLPGRGLRRASLSEPVSARQRT